MPAKGERGFALLTTVIIVLIAGILLSGTVNTTRDTERTAGNAIQYSRAMEAAEGGAVIAQSELQSFVENRVFADETASEGIFSLDALERQWWKDTAYQGQHQVEAGKLLGVADPPRYAYELVGDFVSDGGTGVANLDIGGASYSLNSAGGREHVLYRIESYGVGSKTDVNRAIETVFVTVK